MKTRATGILVLLAAALFAFIFLFERHARHAAAARPGLVLPDLAPAAVTAVRLQPAGQPELRAEHTNGTWRLTRPLATAAQAAGIENLLQACAEITWHTRLAAADLADRASADREFGFATPVATLELRQAGQIRQLQIGNRTALGDEIYVRVGGANDIYVVTAELLKFLPRSANDWRDPVLFSLKNLAFDRLIVTNGTKAFELQRDATNQVWRLTRPLEARADNPKIEELLRRLQTLRAAQFITDDPQADLEPFGLQPAGLELTLAQGTNTVLALQFGKSPTNHAGQFFAKRGDQPGVSLVAGDLLAPWRGDYVDFRDRHLVDLSAVTVDELEARGPENFTVHRQSNDVWRVTAPADWPADAALVRDLLASLAGLQVTQFVKTVVTEPGMADYGLVPPAGEIFLKTGASNAVIAGLDFSAPQDGRVFARRADETSVYALRAADLRRLAVAGWQLRERRLWNFTEENVTRLVLRQRGQTRELLRQGTNMWAFAAGSQGIINSFAVEETVHRLGELAADSWAARGETNRARLGFGGDALQIAVAVSRAGKTETLALDFNGVTPQRPPYAAIKLDGETWFFEFSPVLAELIRSYLCLPAPPP